MDESLRQQAFLQAIAGAATSPGLREQGQRAARGLEAYRANAEAIADRALVAAYPTVHALIGHEDFGRLAREFWRAQWPLRGDLGEWGGEFPAWLQTHHAMAAWPYLADCARLDLAMHRNERAADASLDTGSLSLLESTDPAQLRLELMPGCAIVRSAWPVASIHAAHRLEGADADRAFDAVREAIAARRAEAAMVARQGWRAVVHRLDPADAAWTAALLDDATLDAALVQAGASFDFGAWLQAAIRNGWLKGVTASND